MINILKIANEQEDRVKKLEIEVDKITEIYLLLDSNCNKEIIEMQIITEFALRKENRGRITIEIASILLNSKIKANKRLYSLRQLGIVKWKKGEYSVIIRKTGLNLLEEILKRRYALINEKIQRRYTCDLTKKETELEEILNLEIKIAIINEINLFLNYKYIMKIVNMKRIIEFSINAENKGRITLKTAGELLNSKDKAYRILSFLKSIGLVIQKKIDYSITTNKTGFSLLKEILERNYILSLYSIHPPL